MVIDTLRYKLISPKGSIYIYDLIPMAYFLLLEWFSVLVGNPNSALIWTAQIKCLPAYAPFVLCTVSRAGHGTASLLWAGEGRKQTHFRLPLHRLSVVMML